MTQQIPDFFYYEGQELKIVGINGEGLYTPKDFEIETGVASTACWRGYIMRYEIKDNQLFMEGFLARLQIEPIPPDIDGIAPIRITKENNPMGLRSLGFNYDYRNVYVKLPFTGSLLLGNKPLREEYVHMGYPSATSFQVVLKFEFKNGDLVKVEDKSEDAEEARLLRGDSKGYSPDSDSPEDIQRWIEKRFSLNHDL